MSKQYNFQRIPSPPPTLIRRYSYASSSTESVIKPTAILALLDSERERKTHRDKLKGFKQLAKTNQSSYIEGTSYQKNLKKNFKSDTHRAFRCSKIYSLRKSPACIVWPGKPVEPEPEEEEGPMYESGEDAAGDDVSSKPASIVERMKKNGRESTDSDAASKKKKRRSLRRSLETTFTVGDEYSDEEEDGHRVRKNHSNSSFWNYAFGSIRVDSIHIGAPRRDPYNSHWTRDQRRCFFTSGFIPPHQRKMIPVVSSDKKEISKRSSGTLRP